MKKAINKTERHHLILSLVGESATAKAQTIVDTLVELRKQVREVLLENWQDNFPGISRQDQTGLLECRGAVALSFKPSIYSRDDDADAVKSVGEFGKFTWANRGPESRKALVAQIATVIYQNCDGTSGVFSENVTTGYSSYLYIHSTYPDVINGMQPAGLYDASVDLPKDLDPIVNDVLMVLYGKINAQLVEFKDLIYAGEDAYQALSAAMAPIKTAQQMAELFPESVKHFPPSLTFVKPTKEIADPKAINDIRAKLAKGLPI